MSAPLALDDRARAQLYTGLSRALGAGMDTVRTLEAITDTCDGNLSKPIRRCANAVRKGSALATALQRQGLLSELDYALISVSEDAGRLDRLFERLADRYTRADARWRKMKGRLLLPLVIFLVAIVALPIPALFAGQISVGRYVWNTTVMIAFVVACIVGLRMLALHWRAHGPPTLVTRVARIAPGFRKMSTLHEWAEVSDAMALSLASGIPASQALGNLIHAQANGVRRSHLVRAKSALDGGLPLADALEEAALIDSVGGYAIVSAGEQAGRLEQTLAHRADALNDELDDIYNLLAQWIPILAYFSVAGVVAAGLIG